MVNVCPTTIRPGWLLPAITKHHAFKEVNWITKKIDTLTTQLACSEFLRKWWHYCVMYGSDNDTWKMWQIPWVSFMWLFYRVRLLANLTISWEVELMELRCRRDRENLRAWRTEGPEWNTAPTPWPTKCSTTPYPYLSAMSLQWPDIQNTRVSCWTILHTCSDHCGLQKVLWS